MIAACISRSKFNRWQSNLSWRALWTKIVKTAASFRAWLENSKTTTRSIHCLCKSILRTRSSSISSASWALVAWLINLLLAIRNRTYQKRFWYMTRTIMKMEVLRMNKMAATSTLCTKWCPRGTLQAFRLSRSRSCKSRWKTQQRIASPSATHRLSSKNQEWIMVSKKKSANSWRWAVSIKRTQFRLSAGHSIVVSAMARRLLRRANY